MAHASMLSDEEAAACLRAIAERGDRGAYLRLFESYAPRIKAQAMRAGLSPTDAEDVAQDALLKIWLRAATYTPAAGRVSGWIAAIASHSRIDALRRVRPTTPLMEETSNAIAQIEVADSLDDDRLHRALRDLPSAQRHVLELAYFSDQPQAQIAATLQIPLGTVKSRIRLAIAQLRAALADR